MIKLSDLLKEAAYVQLPSGEEPEELISKDLPLVNQS